MRTVTIPKHNGSFRTVYVPSSAEAASYRSFLSDINRRVDALPCANVLHGFRHGRSAVTMATEHVGRDWTVCMDLADFFPHCTRNRLAKRLTKPILDACLVDGHAAQGIPSSPALANLAGADIDESFTRTCKKRALDVVYTRYADDITVSGNEPLNPTTIIDLIRSIAHRCGFPVNERKTTIYRSAAGRRIICGVSVGMNDIKLPRATRRRLRAAEHQARMDPANLRQQQRTQGLRSWSQLRLPKRPPFSDSLIGSADIEHDIESVCRTWNFPIGQGKRNLICIPDKGGDMDLGRECLITCDPVLHIGMSTFTTGWTSCMRHPSGGHRKGTRFWALFPGTRLAAYFDFQKPVRHGGVKRPAMRARSLVHRLDPRDVPTSQTVLVYDRLYGGTTDTAHLKKQFENSGILSIGEARQRFPNARIAGVLPVMVKPWCDTLVHATICRHGKKVIELRIGS